MKQMRGQREVCYNDGENDLNEITMEFSSSKASPAGGAEGARRIQLDVGNVIAE